MPLFVVEQNRLADSIGASALTVYLHTAAPTDADITNGRTTTGGGAYENGKAVAATDISDAADGDIEVTADIAFGEATASVRTVTHWSAVRGGAGVGWGTVPKTAILQGDSFTLNANTVKFNGSST